MLSLLKELFKVTLATLIAILLWANLALYYRPSFESFGESSINADVYHQLNFLEAKLKAGEGQKMQRLFPEGFVFINVLYGLTWCNVLAQADHASPVYTHGISEIDRTLAALNSNEGKRIFPKDLPLPYGAFYHGWTTYLLGSKLLIQSDSDRDNAEVVSFKDKCLQIKVALDSSAVPYLESYRGQIWPADMMTLLVALRIHDELFEEEYSEVISTWVNETKEFLDPSTGLIPHSIGREGDRRSGARGSSQSLILTLLFDIDEDYAAEQYASYKELFQDSRFGLPGIREYPKGVLGKGDVDSGPVILEIGGAASIVGQQLAGKANDWDLYCGLRNSIEFFGVSFTIKEKKRYVLGQLPMVDAFVAWSNSIETSPIVVGETSNWRLKFQVGSGVVLVVLGILFFLIREA
jgi:hypothetical protein